MTLNKKKPQRQYRSKHLHLIYFFEGGKTRSYKITMLQLKVYSAIISLICLWSLVSIFIVMREADQIEFLSSRLKTALEFVFQHDSKNGQLFEKIYGPIESDIENEPVMSGTKVQEEASPVEGVKPGQVQALEKNQQASNLLTAKKFFVLQDSQEAPVLVQNPVIKSHNKHFELNFGLKNKQTKGKAHGVVWVVMEWINNEGAKHNLTLAGSNDSKGLVRGSAYNIRIYKPLKFLFEQPAQFGTLSKIEVMVQDASLREYKFELTDKKGTD